MYSIHGYLTFETKHFTVLTRYFDVILCQITLFITNIEVTKLH